MLDALFGPAVPVMQGALGFEAARERVIAHNIANFNTPGFQAKDLFKTMLSDAEVKFEGDEGTRAFDYEERTTDDPPQRPDGNNVDPESQMANLADAELRYRALSQMTSKYFRGLGSVISGSGQQ